MFDFLSVNFTELTQYLFDANKRIFWLYLVAALLLAIPVFWQKYARFSLLAFLKFALPKRVYTHPSARHDYALLVINKFIKAALFPLVVITMAPVAMGVSSAIEYLFGYLEPIAFSTTAIIAIFTVLLFLFDDFTRFILHYLLHKIPVLWEFHKVHHSAKVLTPFTIYRSHPVESLLYAFRMTLTQGFVVGLCYYLFGPTLKMYDILGANALVFLFNFCGSNLRHSHIWLSWGDKIEKYFISPAQHQIHHSDNPKHFDTNFGSALAVWDRIFSCHIKASQVGKITYGISVHHQGHNSLLQIYLEPFKKAAISLLPKR
ncbi:sterol desaturase family protein [Colwellia piezophila]|uniref:sterol desaturase family protein n=1 Tax=Colwellia piezophila TaxID=211668 RepID=UPI0003644F14|nr:sterol desaturase family protein [Colwellia piezophila]